MKKMEKTGKKVYKTSSAPGGAFFQCRVNGKLMPTQWGRNRYDMTRFLRESCGKRVSIRVKELV